MKQKRIDKSTKIKRKNKPKKKINPMSTLGVLSIGIKEAYKERGELYDDYLKNKIGIK